jgi:hypothetical protein
MRRVKSDYVKLSNLMNGLRGQADAIVQGLEKEGASAPAGKMRLVAKSLESICGVCSGLGNTAPGLDESNLKKAEAEWKICRRLATKVTGLGSMGWQHQRMLEGMTETDKTLQQLVT